MIKAFAIAAALTLTAAGAQAAEVGIRNSAGSTHRTITHGISEHSYRGGSQYRTRTDSVAVTEYGGIGGEAGFCPPGQSECGGPSAENPANFGGTSTEGGFDRARTRSTTVSTERGWDRYNGSESSRFAGGDSSVFSETSIFAN